MIEKRSLNTEQTSAIKHGQGPLLIIAGAGTGKTTVITERVKNLINEMGVESSSILALTFTEKAASEMQNRIDEALPYGYSQLWLMTFHSFCDRVLRESALHIGLNPSFDLLTEAENLMLLKKNIFDMNLKYFLPHGNPMKFSQGLLSHFSRLSDDDISTEDYLKFAKSLKKGTDSEKMEKDMITELANAYAMYSKLKAEKGVMDFSDLISNCLKLFRERPNILEKYQEKFNYILVDEFQDTNYAQNELAILLSGKRKNITVVGDDDQSIYRFRGAALANMIQFRNHFPNSKIISLTKNYRSTQNILDCSYELIQKNNPYRLEVQEKINKKLTSERGLAGDPPEFIYSVKPEDEAENVIKKIKEEISKNKRSYRDFAVLVRANDHALPFQRAFERNKIPAQFLGPGRLFQQEVVKDLIAYLKVLSDVEDTASLYRVLTNPIFNIPAQDIATTMAVAKRKNKSLFTMLKNTDGLSISDETKKTFSRISSMLKKHLELIPNESAGQILFYFFEDSGLLGHYLDPDSQKTERDALNIAKFFERIQNYSSDNQEANIFNVVDWIDLSMQLGESPLAADMDWTENNAVNILTVHSSKGLEFPVVFVVNLVTQRFPGRERKEQIPVPQNLIKEELPQGDENLQEERRLFYVAMTRAKDKLYLTASKYYGDGKQERKVSPFVFDALGEETINNVLKKHILQNSSEQLSLLETLKPVVQKMETDRPEEKEVQRIDYISYSQLQTFDVCPLHYKLRYIMKLPFVPSAALSFGTSMHAAISSLYQHGFGREKIEETVAKKIIDQTWIEDGYESKAYARLRKKNAEELLIEYMRANLNEEHLPTLTEYPFNFYLEGVKVLGRFDRVDKVSNGKIEIIDYKTGENIPDQKKLDNDLQLTLYALASQSLKEPIFQVKPEEIDLTLYYIETNKKLTTKRTHEQLELAKEKIATRLADIITSDFRCSGSIICQNCEYKILCSAHRR